jgi:hypothetical protein
VVERIEMHGTDLDGDGTIDEIEVSEARIERGAEQVGPGEPA